MNNKEHDLILDRDVKLLSENVECLGIDIKSLENIVKIRNNSYYLQSDDSNNSVADTIVGDSIEENEDYIDVLNINEKIIGLAIVH